MMVTPTVRLLSPLGAGGMGSVWVAEHLALRSRVVVKFMAESLASVPTAVERFAREAAAASQVRSPHVVQMHDHGVREGRPYIIMELLEGHDLAVHIAERGPLPVAEVASIVGQLSRALGKAHGLGIVHRDIKPSNIFLLDTGEGEPFVKLLDFGVAKASALALGQTTESGSFLGSPLYMSPEQLLGQREIDPRADLWAVGVVAFEALTPQRPFVAETIAGLALRIHQEPPPRVTALRPALPAAIDAWFAKACAKAPGDRFGSSRELAEALSEALGLAPRATSEASAGAAPRVVVPSDRPPSEPAADLALARTAALGAAPLERRRLVGVGVAAVALAGGLALGFLRQTGRPDAPLLAASGASPGASGIVAPAESAAPSPLVVPSAAVPAPQGLAPDAGSSAPASARRRPGAAPAPSIRHGAAAPSAAKLPTFDDDIK